MTTLWEETQQVERFAAKQPDHRLVQLLESFDEPRLIRGLDLGCASGRNTVPLAHAGFDFQALDSSAPMIEKTRERVAAIVGESIAADRVRFGVMEDLGDGTDRRRVSCHCKWPVPKTPFREVNVTDSARILGVNPVIPVRRMQESLAFYETKLGFHKVFDDAAEPGMPVGYAGVMRGGVCLHLQAMVPGQDDAMPLLRIAVQHIDSLYAAYEQKGVVSPGARLEAKPWGSRDFGVYDPNGAALVFYEDL